MNDFQWACVVHTINGHHIRDFLAHMQDVQGPEGGATRDYLAAAFDIPAYHTVIRACAICYLTIYVPVIASLEHIEGREELNEHDMRVYTTLVELEHDPERLLQTGGVVISEKQKPHALLEGILLGSRILVRGSGSKADPELVTVLKVLCSALARAFHHYHIEHMQYPHGVAPEDVEWDAEYDAFIAKGGASAWGLSPERLESLLSAPVTSKASESAFGRLRYVRLQAITRSVDKICGLTLLQYNKTPDWLIKNVLEADSATANKIYAMIRKMHRASKKKLGTAFDRALARGRLRKQLDDAIIAKQEEKQAKLDCEVKRLQGVRDAFGEPTWPKVKALKSDELLDHIRAMKLLDKKDLHLTAASSKVARLRLVVSEYKLTVNEDELLDSANTRGPRRPSGRRRSSGMHEVDLVVGARTTDGVRLYCIRWLGYTEEDDEWLPYAALAGVDSDGELGAPHADVEISVAELDAVADDDLPILAGMDREVEESQTAPLMVGARVLVEVTDGDDEPVWTGGVVSGLTSNITVSVLIDGSREPRTYPRQEVLRVSSSMSLSSGTRVRMAWPDELCARFNGKRWYYGVIDAADSRGELYSVRFDNGDVVESVPAFEINVLHAAPALPPTRGRGGRGRAPKRARDGSGTVGDGEAMDV